MALAGETSLVQALPEADAAIATAEPEKVARRVRGRRVRPPKKKSSAGLMQSLRHRFWRQEESLSMWKRRASEALSRLARPCDEADVELDISPDMPRLPSVEELCEAMVRRQLRLEGLMAPLVPGNISDAELQVEAALDALEAAAPAAEPSPKRLRPSGNELGEAEQANVVPVEAVQEFRRSLAGTESAALKPEDFVGANRQGSFCVYGNAVQGDPHARWVERVAARCGITPPLDADLAAAAEAVPASAARLADGEIILTVAVCNTLGHKDQEFEVLASQKLSELRDALYFASDWMFDGPTRLRSASFFIDGTFYSDMRDPTAMDYSVEIIEWLKQVRAGKSLKRERSLSMETKFSELERIVLGERCVYIHQGDLEHNFYITGARLANPRFDCPFVEAYPVLTFMRRHHKRRCYVCWQNFAMWIVLDSHRCPHNPSFWCAQCFRHFFQDAEGEYLAPVDYKVFPYLHDDV